MNPRVANHGRSFNGAILYYNHDVNAQTQGRIDWSSTCNMLTDDPDKAWKVMAYTVKHQDRLKAANGIKPSGRKDIKPVMAYSLSWHPDHDPSREHMEDMAMQSIKELGLEEHEAVLIAHNDTKHKHVHVIVNRIHPLTGLMASDSHTWRKLSEFSRLYQREHNMDYCPQREENYRKRQEGIKTRYRDPVISAAWEQSDSGKSFLAALEAHGYKLALGRKRVVVVDPYGKTHNPVRHIEGIKVRDLNAKLTDLDVSLLPDADVLSKKVQSAHEAKKQNRDNTAPDLQKDFNQTGPLSEITLKRSFSETAFENSKIKQLSRDNDEAEAEPCEKTVRLARMQERHIRERSELSQHHQRRIEKEKEHLSTYYKLGEQRSAISSLDEKCRSQPFWRRILGLARKDKQRLEELKLSLQNSRVRFNERISSLEDQHERSKQSLDTRHKAELENIKSIRLRRENRTLCLEQRPTRSYERFGGMPSRRR